MLCFFIYMMEYLGPFAGDTGLLYRHGILLAGSSGKLHNKMAEKIIFFCGEMLEKCEQMFEI